MSDAFDPRLAILTASDSGIGKATAVALARTGMQTSWASPGSSYVTGSSWPVDGGMLLMGPQAGSHVASDDWRRAADGS
jgi:hypothetical protein